MNKYIGIKLIEAKEMTRGEYNTFKGWEAPKGEDQTIDGHMIKYQDGYTSWCPDCQFKTQYLKVDDNPKLPSGVSIGPKMVKDFIKSYEVIERDGKTTIVHATLMKGFK